MSKINKILVANRGEISLRIMRTAREMGISTVAVFSEADRFSPHVLYADEAVCLGASPASESYLRMDKIIQAGKDFDVDAIHPGYGFLSENADFARKVLASGLIFIGPSPESIELMGNKLRAKQTVATYNIPLLPGTNEPITDVFVAINKAKEIGYPIIIKASAGGGGKGMRIVENENEFEFQMERAVSEAVSAFGDGAVFIEKYISAPRHIEIQILGDKQGNIVHLFERECSIQRRHQKVIEEAPSAVVSAQMRAKMGEAAIGVARACGYYGAGTVEFIVDDKLDFYFLEMNTRLQVEHPVTEMITGKDLVREQIKIAAGCSLEFAQEELQINGHALEVRVYAEDPASNFLPDIGKLVTYRRPQGPGVRVDDGFEEGMSIPIFYDPMLAKLVVHAQDRGAAIAKMISAIDDYKIIGIKTTLRFCKFVLQHEAFLSGNFDTKFIEKYFDPLVLEEKFTSEESELLVALAIEFLIKEKVEIGQNQQVLAIKSSSWKKRLD